MPAGGGVRGGAELEQLSPSYSIEIAIALAYAVPLHHSTHIPAGLISLLLELTSVMHDPPHALNMLCTSLYAI